MWKSLGLLALLIAAVCLVAFGLFRFLEARAWPALAVVGLALLPLAWVFLKPAIRRHLVLPFLFLAMVPLAACASFSPLKVDPKLSAEAQVIQAKAKADFDAALAARLDHCTITGTLSVTAQASPNAGATTSGGFTCEAKPWSASPSGAAATP